MLEAISICNFALIDELTMELEPGLNVISGETGAGKSIIIDALGMALGERASADFLRTGVSSARVEAVFTLEPHSSLKDSLTEAGVSVDNDQVILARELNASGRNYCRLNGRLVTTAQLKEVAQQLVDIHGQHQHQSLLRPATHICFLDAFGGPDQLALASRVNRLYHEYNQLSSKMKNYRQMQSERAQKIDMLRYQIKEIETANLVPGEWDELEQERDRLNQREDLLEAVAGAYKLLYGGALEQGAVDLVGQAQVLLEQAAATDKALSKTHEELTASLFSLEELVPRLRQYQEDFPQDQKRLHEVQERLELIRTLKRKYGKNVPAILHHVQVASTELENLELEQADQTKLAAKLDRARNLLVEAAEELANSRRRTATLFQQQLQRELADLGMDKAQLQVAFKEEEDDSGLPYGGRKLKVTASGFEQVEFLLAANPGARPQPLSKIASGGEIARTMLAIKTVLAGTDDIPTLIFDEVDAGVGGRAAQKVGYKLDRVSKFHQVICITHLPQIAARGNTHFYIYKETRGGRTYTKVNKLSSTARIQELARMLAGSNVNAVVLQHAKQLLAGQSER